jgi:hypothetical protein
MNKVATVTWVSIGVLAAIIVIAMLLMRGGQ